MKKRKELLKFFPGIIFSAACMGCVMITPVAAAPSAGDAVTNFSVRLFQASKTPGSSTLVSPFSVLSALSMTANGAGGSTLAQMEEAFGISVKELNDYFNKYLSEQNDSLSVANSIWLNEHSGLLVSPDFTETVTDFYQSEVFEEPMNGETLDKINGWVNEKTEGMIPEILDEIQPDTLMYLLNALSFQSKWETVYGADDVFSGTFTEEDGTERETDMMRSTESVWLEGEGAQGFLKYYEGGRYAFAALLPEEGTSLDDYVDSLTGEKLSEILSRKKEGYTVHAVIPKFRSETSKELTETLKSLGITDAFSQQADFSRMYSTAGNPGVKISEVVHKTFIDVNEQETKAAAATEIGIVETALITDDSEKYISLDRPFLYMLVDCQNDIPLFLGTMYSPEN
ncbi:MAG TPA: serpin family protein [Candidatus Blautia intestinavium]|nr:serpin family protein [Candidatus Blautia intestinavium]